MRLAILVAVALLVAHTAIYAAEDGLGAAFAAAMSRGGHDGWWLPASVAVVSSGALVACLTALRMGRLELRARRLSRASRRPGPSFAREVVSIARRLVPLVLVLFALQENLEVLIAHGRVLGIDAVVGPTHPLAIPVLVAIALALSAAGALVRWRIAILRRRLATGRRPARRGIAAPSPAPRWRTVGGLDPHRWMLGRPDAGRAPPRVLPI